MNRRLVKTLLGGVSLAALSCPAFAADMPVKATPAQVAANSWTGFYGGLHVGEGWSNRGDGLVTVQSNSGSQFTQNVPVDRFAFGGAQVGYNWQLLSRWVIGLEADISAGQHTDFNAQLAWTGIPSGVDTIGATRGLDWFGTVRARIGFLFTPTVLIYGTGGWLYGHARNDLAQMAATAVSGTSTVTGPSISTGWTAGGGIEWAFSPKWSVNVEYDYLRFNDSVTVLNFIPAGNKATSAFAQLPDNSSQTVRVGLNYHFWN